MAEDKEHREPAGFTPHTAGLASEYAREQGWDINEAERMKTPTEKQNYDGGVDYDYGAQDFGDTATDTSSANPQNLGVRDQAAEARTEDRSRTPRSEDL